MLIQQAIVGKWQTIKNDVDIDNTAFNTGFLTGFIEGEKKGAENAIKKIIQTHIDNIKKTANIAEKISVELRNNYNIDCPKIFINTDNFGVYSIMFLVDLNTYASDSMKSAYIYLMKHIRTERSSQYYVDFSFLYDEENLNIDLLICDGYKLFLDGSLKPC